MVALVRLLATIAPVGNASALKIRSGMRGADAECWALHGCVNLRPDW